MSNKSVNTKKTDAIEETNNQTVYVYADNGQGELSETTFAEAIQVLEKADWEAESVTQLLMQGENVPANGLVYTTSKEKAEFDFSILQDDYKASQASKELSEVKKDMDSAMETLQNENAPETEKPKAKQAKKAKKDSKETSGDPKDERKEVCKYTATGKVLRVGDYVIDTEHKGDKRVGQVLWDESKGFLVHFSIEGKPKTQRWARKWMLLDGEDLTNWQAEQKAQTALIKSDGQAIEAEPVLPMTQEEIDALNASVDRYKEYEANEAKFFIKRAVEVSFILDNKLYRNDYATFELFAKEKLDLHGKHAFALAQIGKFVTAYGVEDVNFSQITATTLARNTNKLMQKFQIADDNLNVLKPLVQSTIALAQKLEDEGVAKITPRSANAIQEVVETMIAGLPVMVNGKEYTIKEAVNLNLTDEVVRQQVTDKILTGLEERREIMLNESRQALQRQQTPVKNAGSNTGDSSGSAIPKHKGKLPVFNHVCSLHGDVYVKSIGTGKIIYSCDCRTHIDNDTERETPYMVAGKEVKQSK